MVQVRSLQVDQAVRECVVTRNNQPVGDLVKSAARDTVMNFRLFQLGEKVPAVVTRVFANMKYPEYLPELNKEMPVIFANAAKAMCVSRAYGLLYSVVQWQDDKGLDKTWESWGHEVFDTVESCSHVALLMLKYNPTVHAVAEAAGFVANVVELKMTYDEYSEAGDSKFEAAVQERTQAQAPAAEEINTPANKKAAFGAKQTETMYKMAKLSCSILSAVAGYFLAASSLSFYLGFVAVLLAVKAWQSKNGNGMRVADMAHVKHGLTAYKNVDALLHVHADRLVRV